MRKWRALAPLAVAVAALGISACGSSSSSSKTSSTVTNAATTGKTGGTLTVLDVAGGVDSLDPGYWYYQTDYSDLGDTTQRQLYGWPPNAETPVPDLATALPAVSDGGKTLTIHIKPGIHYSAPLASETVKSADIKYAMERCFDGAVGNGYSGSYYGHIVGVPSTLPTSSVPDISGLQTPDDTTLVIKLTQPVGVLSTGQALTLPCTTPIPQVLCGEVRQGRDAVLRAAPGVRRPVHDQGRRVRHGAGGGLHRQQGPGSRSQPELGGDQVDRLPPRLRRRDRDQGGLPARGRFAEDPQRLRPAER